MRFETCFACGAEYRWGTAGSGTTLALCPECNAVAEDIAPAAGHAYGYTLIGMACIALTAALGSWVPMVTGAAAVIRTSFRLDRLGARIRAERVLR